MKNIKVMAGVIEVSVKLAHHFYIFLSATKTPRMSLISELGQEHS